MSFNSISNLMLAFNVNLGIVVRRSVRRDVVIEIKNDVKINTFLVYYLFVNFENLGALSALVYK
jgi:hypothetical protein